MQNTISISTPLSGKQALITNTLLIAAAVILPALTHLAGLPAKIALPMHFPVLLAGLMCGSRGGLAAGLLSPAVSFMLSGMPPGVMLPVMTAELAVYGALTGAFKYNFKLNSFFSILIALIAGKAVFAALIFFASGTQAAHTFLTVSLPLALPAVALQLTLIPALAKALKK
ncbi:Protein of unknown function (DUF3816) [Parelusimicrobium proximum]|uniref:ECF transporter S component n=1 Tax=Parelusimicrobium proximum TaxID=3228953 RepID=UPI003D17C664